MMVIWIVYVWVAEAKKHQKKGKLKYFFFFTGHWVTIISKEFCDDDKKGMWATDYKWGKEAHTEQL